jgi:hypothetical protein
MRNPQSQTPSPGARYFIEEVCHESHVEQRLTDLNRRRRNADANPVKGRHKRQMKELRNGIVSLASVNNGNDVGFLTITSSEKIPWKDEMLKVRKINRLLNSIFPHGWVRFVEYTEKGALHHHIVGRATFNLAEGFNFDAYDRHRALSKLDQPLTDAEKVEKRNLGSKFTENAQLKATWEILRAKLKKFGFGVWFELTPIQKGIKNIAGYMADGFYTTIRHTQKKRPVGSRLYACSRNFPRVKLPDGPGKALWKERCAVIFQGLGVTKEQMTVRYATNWNYALMKGLMDISIANFEEDVRLWNPKAVGRIVEEALLPWDRWNEMAYRRRQKGHDDFMMSLMPIIKYPPSP